MVRLLPDFKPFAAKDRVLDLTCRGADFLVNGPFGKPKAR